MQIYATKKSPPDIVGQFDGDFQRKFAQSADPPFAAPDGLVDQFPHAPFLDRVDVPPALFEQTPDDGARAFVVAGDERTAAHCEAVLHFRRYLRVFLAVDQPVVLELLERRAERVVRNAA